MQDCESRNGYSDENVCRRDEVGEEDSWKRRCIGAENLFGDGDGVGGGGELRKSEVEGGDRGEVKL